MPPLTLRQRITALALAAALAAPWASAAAPLAREQTAGPGLLHQLWNALTTFRVISLTLDDGCKMDPDGRCVTGSVSTGPTVTLDSGCNMDPNGLCLPGS